MNVALSNPALTSVITLRILQRLNTVEDQSVPTTDNITD